MRPTITGIVAIPEYDAAVDKALTGLLNSGASSTPNADIVGKKTETTKPSRKAAANSAYPLTTNTSTPSKGRAIRESPRTRSLLYRKRSTITL